jgi:isocitrate dehydrogenase
MLADTPEAFDVIVMQNLYGDMLSDVAAQITGSVGLAGSANIGEECAMFEAIHGSAPRIVGQNIANPSGLLQGAIMMLNHIGQSAVAAQIQNAWLKTLEDGIHTPDIYKEGVTKQKVGTQEFAAAVIENLGKKSTVLKSVSYAADAKMNLPKYVPKPPANKELDGVDIFIHWRGGTPDQLAQLIKKIELADIHLSMITNRGIKVWPEGFPETFCTDHWRCRFKPIAGAKLDKKQIIQLLENAIAQDIDVIKTENLYTFDGVPRYSLGQGQ